MFTLLDFIFVGIVVASAVLAFSGGFMSELFSLISWVGAAAITKYLYPLAEPRMVEIFGARSIVSSVSTYVALFVASVFALSTINNWWTGRLRQTSFKGVDSSLGFLFGLVRGVIIAAVAYIVALWLAPDPAERPAWLKSGRSLTLVRTSAHLIAEILPEEGVFKEIGDVVRAESLAADAYEKLTRPPVEDAAASEGADRTGYTDSERKGLLRMIELSR